MKLTDKGLLCGYWPQVCTGDLGFPNAVQTYLSCGFIQTKNTKLLFVLL